MYRNSDLRKAIAFSLFVKAHSRNSIIKNWNINKLHDITGVSVNAIKARLATLRSMDLIEETGVDKKHLVFKSLHSHTAHRNVVLPSVEFKPDVNLKKNAYAQEIKNLENVLVAMLLVEIQRRKDFAEQMIQQKRNPHSKKEYTEAVKTCNRFGYGRRFIDRGISYKYMAAKIGMSIFKSMQIVKFAANYGIVKKMRNIAKRFSMFAKYTEDMLTNYTYSYRNWIYKIYANKYVVL